MKKIFLGPLLFICMNLSAQTTSDTGKIYKKGFNWKLNSQKLNQNSLKDELYKIPESVFYYKKAKTNKTIGFLCVAPAVVFAILGKQNTTTPPFKNNNGFKIASIFSSGCGIYFFIQSSKNLKKAVSLYNEKQKTVY